MFNRAATLLCFISILCVSACNSAQDSTLPPRTLGAIERVDAQLDELLDSNAEIEILAEGHDWTEGPVWVPRGGFLLYSDIPPNSVFKWKEGEGRTLYLKPSGYTGAKPRGGEPGSNGLLLDPSGRLVLCQHGDRRVSRMDAPISRPAARFTSLADRYEGKRFNSPNDGVFDSKGNLYFTDPPYGLEKNVNDPDKEIPFQGVYRLTPDGKVTLLTKAMSRPNGIGLSPDERTLYVANSDPAKALWMAFPILDDGSLGTGRVLRDVTAWVGRRPGLPDGLKVDRTGRIFATGPGGVWIFNPDGTHLGTILTTQATANCAFGDDGGTLYITADMYLLRVRTKTQDR